VTSDVLIPRPETEAIVVRALDVVRQGEVVAADGPVRIVDVGTGSGILAVCLAIHLPDAQVWAIDVSPDALAVARRNAARHGVEERITWVQSDLFAALEAELDFHVAVSNPPYVTTAELERLDVDVRKYEPRLALDGGPEGTGVIARLLDAAPQRLTAGGRMLVEISPTIAERVERLAAAHSALRLIKTHRDLSGQARIVEVARTEVPA
jgi:release factor glutamine methyltransferase